MPLFRAARTSQGRSKPRRSVLWLLLYTFQEERPTGSDEGREVVQWKHLHVPSIFETSVRRLTVYEDRTGCSHRRDCGDLLLGGLSYCIFFYLGVLYPPLLNRTGCSCRRDRGDLLLGGLSYCVFFSSGS